MSPHRGEAVPSFAGSFSFLAAFCYYLNNTIVVLIVEASREQHKCPFTWVAWRSHHRFQSNAPTPNKHNLALLTLLGDATALASSTVCLRFLSVAIPGVCVSTLGIRCPWSTSGVVHGQTLSIRLPQSSERLSRASFSSLKESSNSRRRGPSLCLILFVPFILNAFFSPHTVPFASSNVVRHSRSSHPCPQTSLKQVKCDFIK